MLTNYLFKDLYDDRWGDPCNPNAADPPSSEPVGRAGRQGVLGRLTELFRRRKRPSAWSFTIPSEPTNAESETGVGHRMGLEDPKLLALAKALSRNC